MIKVAVELPNKVGDPGEFVADVRALDAAGAEAIWFKVSSPAHWILVGAVGALTERIKFHVVDAESDSVAVLQKVTGGRVVDADPAEVKWVHVSMPTDREAWVAMLRDQEAAGVTGVILPWDARLIDLLRNREADDRSDLLMSTG